MNNLWEQKYTPLEIINPKEFLLAQCKYLERATKDIIIAKVHEVTKSSDNSNNNFYFEFFITSKSTPNFKYRILYLNHSIPVFPITIIMDRPLADDIRKAEGLAISYSNEKKCDSQEDFECTLKMIFNSKTVTNVINSLLAFSNKVE